MFVAILRSKNAGTFCMNQSPLSVFRYANYLPRVLHIFLRKKCSW